MLLGCVGGIIPQILLPGHGAAGAPNPCPVPGVIFGCAAPRASSTAEKQGPCSAGSSVPQTCPCQSGKAGHSIPILHQVTLCTVPQKGQVSNSMLRNKAKKNLSCLEAWSCKQWLPHTLLIILLKSKI